MDFELDIETTYFKPTLSLCDSWKKKSLKKKQMKGRLSLREIGEGYSGKEDLELINQHELDIVGISNGSKDDNGLMYMSKHINVHVVKFDDFDLDLD